MNSANPIWISSSPSATWDQRAIQPCVSQKPNLLTAAKEQTLRGFGGCFNELGWQALSWLSPAERQAVLLSLFDPRQGSGFTYCRLPIGASDFARNWYSLNENDGDFGMQSFSIERDQQMLIPYIRAAQAVQPDLKFFASPWSPPTWLKSPPVYNYGRMKDDPRILQAYGLYLLKFVQAYQAAGIPIIHLHPQNEPVADQKFPSCKWEPALMAKFIREHLGPLFVQSGIACDIWLGTINSADYYAWADTLLNEQNTRQYIKGIGYQYAGQYALQRTHLSWPELELLQTESEAGSSENSWDEALDQFELMHHYFTNGVSGYIYWNMVLPTGGQSTWGWPQNSLISVDEKRKKATFNPEFYLMQHFGRFVLPGAVRLGTSGVRTGTTLAFENPDGSQIIIAANPHMVERELIWLNGSDCFSANLPPKSINTIIN